MCQKLVFDRRKGERLDDVPPEGVDFRMDFLSIEFVDVAKQQRNEEIPKRMNTRIRRSRFQKGGNHAVEMGFFKERFGRFCRRCIKIFKIQAFRNGSRTRKDGARSKHLSRHGRPQSHANQNLLGFASDFRSKGIQLLLWLLLRVCRKE